MRYYVIHQMLKTNSFPERIEKMYKNLNGLHHQHRADIRSFSCVILSWLNGVTQYCSRNLCGFAYRIFVEYYFNELNLQLQGSELNLIKMRSLISPFISKLAMFKRNLGGREFYQFPSVAALWENGEVHDDDIQIDCDHLESQSHNCAPKCMSLLKSCTRLFQHDIGKLLLP
ncbi:hypothetical protein T06_2220 [Trichinella sp. T6]|nr:hypothetical protein T06_2220 [Trichinella sp. T6]